MDAVNLLRPQLEDKTRRSIFLVMAAHAAEYLGKLAPRYLVNWMLWVVAEHPDVDWKVVEHPFVVAEDYITGASDLGSLAAELDRCAYTLSALLAGKRSTATERALAVTALVGLMATGADAATPRTIANIAVGCIFDLDESSERWAKCLVSLQRHVEMAQDNSACDPCAIDGCAGKAVGYIYCRAHGDACSVDRFSALDESVSFGLADALAFERMSALAPQVAVALQRDVAASAR